jgi:hypothetical protein
MGMATLEERYWAKVRKESENGCWVWTACTTSAGYGVFSVRRRQVLARRFGYELVNPPLAEGYRLRAICENVLCVNPAHMLTELICRDRVGHDYVQGSAFNREAVTEYDVLEIRERYVEHGARICDLARTFGISEPNVLNILKGKSWKHITDGVSVHVPRGGRKEGIRG